MTDFPLIELHRILLEKVITKVFLLIFCVHKIFFQLKDKSYFRLQQTCRGVREFIHSCRKISVHMESITFASVKDFYCHDSVAQFSLRTIGQKWLVDADSLYGVRLKSINLPLGSYWFVGSIPDPVSERSSDQFLYRKSSIFSLVNYISML